MDACLPGTVQRSVTTFGLYGSLTLYSVDFYEQLLISKQYGIGSPATSQGNGM